MKLRKMIASTMLAAALVGCGMGASADAAVTPFSRYAAVRAGKLAISDYSEVIDSEPDNAEAYFNRGLAYESVGGYDEAYADYSKAIELNPQYADAIAARGVLFRSFDDRRTIADCNAAIAINPRCALAYYNRAFGIVICGEEKYYGQAYADLSKAIEINPAYADAYYWRGALLEKANRQSAALADFTKAIELNPYNDLYYLSRAHVYGNLNNKKAAYDDCVRAARYPTDLSYILTVMDLYK